MSNQEIVNFINNLDLSVYKHASNIVAKYKSKKKNEAQLLALPILTNEYYKFISGYLHLSLSTRNKSCSRANSKSNIEVSI